MSEGFADKAAFFGGFKRRFKEAESPFGKVWIGNLSEGEHQQLEKEVDRLRKKKNEAIVRLVYLKWGCWNTDKTARLFNEDDVQRMIAEDIDYAVTRSLVDQIIEHIGTSGADISALAGN